MFKPVTIAEQLLFNTVRIQVQTRDGASRVGTGFFFDFPINANKSVSAVITNKHLIADAHTGKFELHEAETVNGKPQPAGKFFTVTLSVFPNYWIAHPGTNIDLCALPLQVLTAEAQKQGKAIYAVRLDQRQIPSFEALEALSAVEDVLMIGYPTGLWDEVNNLPIVRRGITATHPGVDFCGKSMGVIDAACFPGSSGSPVVLVNESIYNTKTGAKLGNRAVLLGVLFAGPRMTAEGEIAIADIPGNNAEPAVRESVMINLGYYVKAREILFLGEHVVRVLRARGAL